MTTNATLAAPAAAVPAGKSFTRFFPTIARILMGLMFFVFGLNGFLNFIPPPTTPPPDGAAAFGAALMATGYMFPLIKGTELLVGIFLLANCFVPLALLLLAPVLVNILAFHAFLAPTGLVMSIVIIALEGYLAWAYRKSYAPLFVLRARPA